MLFLFVTLISCTALKLSDPVALRDVSEENVSLRSWCVGVGCVMPFTPATCLSWCDWNVDKQADAQARGAFSSEAYGKKNQVKATSFSLSLQQSAINADNAAHDSAAGVGAVHEYYFQKADEDDKKGRKDCGVLCVTTGADSAIFPGGDEEKKFSETSLACATCYKIASGKAKVDAGKAVTNSLEGVGLATHFYIEFKQGAAATSYPRMNMYIGTNGAKGCAGTKVWDPLMTADEVGSKTVKTTDANNDKITDTRHGGNLLEGQVKRGGGGANDGVMTTYKISFSGNKVGGVFAPRACKD